MSDGLEYDESYREYLRSGDLRTAEDVLRWLRERTTEAYPLGQDRGARARIADGLSMALDRARRQSFRKAALMAWRDFRRDVYAGDMRTAFDDEPEWIVSHCSKYLAAALCFRAEARRP